MKASIMRHYRVFPTLDTDRLTLRRAYLTDTDDLFDCMRDPDVSRYETWHPHVTSLETLGFVNDLMLRTDERRCSDWLIERKDDNRVIGVINLHDVMEQNGEAEMGFWLGKAFWHRGYASEAARRILSFAFNDLHLNRVVCFCVNGNTSSEKTIRSLGMTYEGTLRQHIRIKGQFCDIKVFSILKNEFLT